MNRSLIALAVLVVAGCASSPEDLRTEAPLRRSLTVVETGQGSKLLVELPSGGALTRGTVPAGVATLWPVLGEVLADLGLDVNEVDTEAHLLGMRNQRLGRVGGKRPSTYLDCGSGLNGDFANSYEVRATVLAQLAPLSEGVTEVRVLLQASAKDPAHGNNPVRCATTGALERRVIEELRARTGTSEG